ncbi:MAG: TM2 domain-containing protein [Bacteroidales bacterium]|nr:TM2 domain-containing protein [Bacteroidales bacterium]
MLKGNLLKIWLILFFLSLSMWQIKAATVIESVYGDTIQVEQTNHTNFATVKITKPHKITAIILALLTGPLGGHRVYLGTSTQVPLIYTATLGGFGTLVVADIIIILVSKDLSEFQNNDKIFMWISSKQN